MQGAIGIETVTGIAIAAASEAITEIRYILRMVAV